MELTRVLLVAVLILSVVSCGLARPSGHQGQLIDIASELSHSLQEIVDIVQAEETTVRRRSGRRRRMVQMHIGRTHHLRRYYRSRYGRYRLRHQRGGRNANVSDF